MTCTSRTNNNLIEFVVRENVKISFFYVIQKDEYQQVCINRFIFYIASCLLASSKTMINKQVVLPGISEAKYMHYANIVTFDESGIDFLRELFNRMNESVFIFKYRMKEYGI